MINVRTGSQVYQLLQFLSVAGEFSTSSLHLFGNERVLKERVIHRLESVHDVRCCTSGKLFRTNLVSVSGKRGNRTIRLAKGALPVLREMDESAHLYYMQEFGQRNFSGDSQHIDRNHRVAEVMVMCRGAGIAYLQHALPILNPKIREHRILQVPSFYVAKHLKSFGSEELNKTSYTRCVGQLFYPGGSYAVFNTRNAAMRWSPAGELKLKPLLSGIARANAGLGDTSAALMFGKDIRTAFNAIYANEQRGRLRDDLDEIYPSIHFVPLNAEGIRLLRILTLPSWNERLLDALFDDAQRRRGHGSIEYDAYANDRFIHSHLSSDIPRLYRLYKALQSSRFEVEVLCFPWQEPFLREFLGSSVILTPIEMEGIEAALQI